MPPEDSTPIDLSRVYISQEGEAPVPLDCIQEVPLELAEGGVVEPDIVSNAMLGKMSEPIELKAHIDFSSLSAELDALSRVWAEFVKAVKPILECKNRRLLHLAVHGKNARIRKKNIKRIMRGDWRPYD